MSKNGNNMNQLRRLAACFLLLTLSSLSYAIPENAHVLGNNWYCNDGYKKSGNQCLALSVPANAHVLGNNWYCDDGYKKIGNQCKA